MRQEPYYTKFENNIEFDEFLYIIPVKPKYLIVLDVHKAYDFVKLDILNNWIINDDKISELAKVEWLDQLDDFRALNFDISGHILKRTRGIPQGSELSPYLFNYYMTRILEQPEIVDLLKDSAISIYADNIFIVNYKTEMENVNLVKNLNREFMKYNFVFKADELRIVQIDGIGYPTKMKPVKQLDKFDSFKILGQRISIINNKYILNPNDMLFDIKYKYSDYPYKMINIAKKYIIPKFNFHLSVLELWSKELVKQYTNSFKTKLHNWLQQALVTRKIPGVMIDYLIGLKPLTDKYGSVGNTYTFWITKFNNDFGTETKNYKACNRLLYLADIIWEEKIPLTIRSIKKIIFDEEYTPNKIEIKQYENYGNEGKLVKTFQALDRVFNSFVTEKNPLSEIYNLDKI